MTLSPSATYILSAAFGREVVLYALLAVALVGAAGFVVRAFQIRRETRRRETLYAERLARLREDMCWELFRHDAIRTVAHIEAERFERKVDQLLEQSRSSRAEAAR